MEIKAPTSGIVFDLKKKIKRYSAQITETILKLVQIGELQATVKIPNSDIGFVKKGMDVNISIDYFPSADFVVIKGQIISIVSDYLMQDDLKNISSYIYPANIKLDRKNLQLKDGDFLDLKVGMSLNANIKLRKLSYLQLLIKTF